MLHTIRVWTIRYLDAVVHILLQAILLLVIQCLIATFLDAVIVGCIFIKISKPKNRTDTIIFSDKDSFHRSF